MPYDTPYNRMIALEQQRKNMRYADMNAYSNEMYNTNMPFSEVYRELRLPVRTFTPQRAYISNYDGGITNRNMEGSAGVLHRMMRPSVLNEDVRHVGMGARQPRLAQYEPGDVLPVRGRVGKGHCPNCSCRRCGMDGGADMEVDNVEEDDDELAGLTGRIEEMRLQPPAGSPPPARPSAPTPKSPPRIKTQLPRPPLIGKPEPETKPEPKKRASSSAGSPPAKRGKGSKGMKHSKPKHLKSFIAEMSSKTGRKPAELKKDPEVMKEFEEVHQKYVGSGMSGGFLPFLASIAVPYLAKKAIKLFKGKGVSGGSVLGGPSNDPVNKGKITGGRAKDIGEPQGSDTPFMTNVGLHYEGASLGAGVSGGADVEMMVAPKKKGRGKGKKTGASLFKTAPIIPLDVKSGVPPTEEQIEGISDFAETPTGLGKKKKGGMLKGVMPSSSFSGGKAKREPNAWIKHVQAYAKQHKVSYKDAIKQARATYKKM